MKNVGDVYKDESGQEWKVTKVDGDSYFASKLQENGKLKKGRPSKFTDIVSSVETQPVVESDEVQLQLEIK